MNNNLRLFFNGIYKLYESDDVELKGAKDRKSHNSLILATLFSNAFSAFTGGAFLTGFAIYLGIPDKYLGYLGNISTICGFAAVFVGYLVQKMVYLKKYYILSSVICRMLVVSTVWIPLLVPVQLRIPTFFIMQILLYTVGITSSLTSTTMIMNLVPCSIRGRFQARMQVYVYTIGLILPILTSLILDYFNKEYKGYFILYNIAIIFVFFEVFNMSKIRDVENHTIESKGINLIKVFTIPAKNKPFIRFLIEYLSFFIIFNISAVFTDLYILKYLKISFTYLSIANSIGTLVVILLSKRVGQVIDQLGGKYGFRLSQYMHIPYAILIILLTPKNIYPVYMLISIVRSILVTYYSVGQFKHRYDLIPEKGRALYDGFFTTVYGINGILAPLISTFIIFIMEKYISVIDFSTGQQYRILFFISTIGITIFLIIKDITEKEKLSIPLPKLYLQYLKGVFKYF